MIYNNKELLKYIEDNDVKFIKLTFCDINGKLKNISILSSEIQYVLEHGVKITAKKINGFSDADGRDLYLFPDAATTVPLPWRPQQGRVIRMFSYIRYADGSPFDADGRYFLKKAVKFANEKGYCFRFGTSCEFTLFKLDNNGNPTKIPHDYAGYCDTAPDDEGENIRREICLTLENMNIRPVTSYHESGFGQHEIDFSSSSALKAADTFLSFKSAVKSVSKRSSVYASFMPKPTDNDYGNGMHIGINVIPEQDFFSEHSDHCSKITDEIKSAVAGIMKHMRDISLFTNTTVNSYHRLDTFSMPRLITWSEKDGSQIIRITNDDIPVDIRLADCACNPYFVFGLIIYAAIYGIENNLSINDNFNEELPLNLGEAVDIAENSDFLKKYIPENILNYFINSRSREWKEYQYAENKDDFETQKYFYSL